MRTALSRLRVALQLAALAEGLTVGKLRPSQVRSRAHHGAVLVPALCWVDPLTAFCLLMWQVAFFSLILTMDPTAPWLGIHLLP